MSPLSLPHWLSHVPNPFSLPNTHRRFFFLLPESEPSHTHAPPPTPSPCLVCVSPEGYISSVRQMSRICCLRPLKTQTQPKQKIRRQKKTGRGDDDVHLAFIHTHTPPLPTTYTWLVTDDSVIFSISFVTSSRNPWFSLRLLRTSASSGDVCPTINTDCSL